MFVEEKVLYDFKNKADFCRFLGCSGTPNTVVKEKQM